MCSKVGRKRSSGRTFERVCKCAQCAVNLCRERLMSISKTDVYFNVWHRSCLSYIEFSRRLCSQGTNYSEINQFGFVPNFSCERCTQLSRDCQKKTSTRKFLILLACLPSLSSRLKIFVLYTTYFLIKGNQIFCPSNLSLS